MPEQVLKRFVASLAELSSRDLFELAALLRSSDGRTAAIDMIVALGSLKSSQAKQQSQESTETKLRPVQAESQIDIGRQGEDLEKFFVTLLQDRSSFPSIDSVANTLDRILGTNFRASKDQKLSRDRLIKRAWNQLTQFPTKERDEKLKALCKYAKRIGTEEEYKELFKILSRSE